MAVTTFSWPVQALPEVVVAGRFPLDDRDFAYIYRSPTHALHLYDYHGIIRSGDSEQVLRPGDFTISPCGGGTRYHLPEPGHHWCIHFRPVATSSPRCTLPLHLALGTLRSRIADAIARISGLLASPGNGRLNRAAATHALQELLLTIAAAATAAPARERTGRSLDAVAQATAHLDAHLAEELSVPRLATHIGMSQNWLAKAFHDHHGQTMQRYLLSRRIAHAQDLLTGTDLPVARIAQRLGFGDGQHFNKQFRRLAGCNPTAYRLRGSRRGP